MKRLLLSTLFLFFAVAAFAQKGAVSGTVLDADTGESVALRSGEIVPCEITSGQDSGSETVFHFRL